MIPKFRVWDKNNKKMLNWKELDLTKELGEDEITIFEPTGQFAQPMYFYETMQSTGLKDKNGTEIYEGDIVELKYPYDKRIKTKGSIVWDRYKSCFGISMKETTERYELYRITAENYLTVIGNKYQHPELLEDE
ncbi:YopX family protein [Staphylococcus haemolyticus]|uniref:YopX family protein n=1 Tax=Staphylococcus haemolyticus TaxID=1283 RepID=UPI0029006B43|nr:YopX family protein [Staphylococcus haemolyticus]MDU0441550.1 YopX family protein [Staphylococcus haemolyticus]MDU0473668.1 YopX family protein [Staphylococcus haemolyticus]